MRLVCLDLEGVLVPEIWIAFSEAVGIPEFARTTRDEPDYDKLMRFRLALLEKNGLRLPDIQKVISGMEPLAGAIEFTRTVREKTQLVILSDTYEEFARPLMAKLSYPTLFCNSLTVDGDGKISGYRLRQKNGKAEAVRAFKSLNIEIFAAGDSFNDLAMIHGADAGCLFRAPPNIVRENSAVPSVETYAELLAEIEKFL
jgi:phosphoserine/homoserine phosphotransferase